MNDFFFHFLDSIIVLITFLWWRVRHKMGQNTTFNSDTLNSYGEKLVNITSTLETKSNTVTSGTIHLDAPSNTAITVSRGANTFISITYHLKND